MLSRAPLLVTLLLAGLLHAQDAGKAAKSQSGGKRDRDDGTAFTLENIFPEKDKLFGPAARAEGFSHDGRLAAYRWRPLVERRHGGDLWLYDVETRKSRRLTDPVVLAEYLADARKVAEHRREQAKKELKGKELEKVKKELGGELGRYVGEDDWKAEKAPRWGGVSSVTWAPEAAELLFTADGDIFRYLVADDRIERLTRTRASERSVEYLPDGSGYTYLLDGALMRVTFGSHLVVQLDPRLPRGQELRGYELSPDGKFLALVAREGGSWRQSGRKVGIASYRDRFMKVREVSRTVSDDPKPDAKTHVYLHSVAEILEESGGPTRVFSHEYTGPRDVVTEPTWSPDSSAVTFARYAQREGTIEIRVAKRPEPESEDDGEAKQAKAAKEKAGAGKGGKREKREKDDEDEEEEKDGDDAGDDDAKGDPSPKEVPARLVYKFLHHGGPNTPRMVRPEFIHDSRHIAVLTEVSGFRHLHLLDPLYESLTQLTRGRFEVYPIGLAEDRKSCFVTATAEHPSRVDVYRVDLDSGEMKRLTRTRGAYSDVEVGPQGRHLLARFGAYGRLPELVHVDTRRHRQTDVTTSHPERTAKLTKVAPEFFSFENRHGHEIQGLIFKPDGWRKSDQRPLLIYVYGGPLGTRKNVLEGSYHSDVYFFQRYMAEEHGYVTVTIDPRGMSGYGGLFEKANYERVGRPQVEDLADGVRYLVAEHGVDAERVGIHGWSFGGFQTQMCLYTEPEVFHVGIAGAGPTEWENYNAWYSTGTIGESREGSPDLKKFSLLPLAKKLEGELMLVHGMEDSNVLYQDTVRVYRELLKAGKETHVELFLDPTGGHGLGGDIKRLGRARKYEEFLVRYLGKGEGRADLTVVGAEGRAGVGPSDGDQRD